MKLPVGGRLGGQEISSAISVKFVTNPLRVEDKDKLFELLEASKNENTKYFFVLNPNNQANPSKDMTVEQKMFRKFFYENSSFVDGEAIFAEITDPTLALEQLSIANEHQVVAVQNKNELSSFKDTTVDADGRTFKRQNNTIFNLDVEIMKLDRFRIEEFEVEFLKDKFNSKPNLNSDDLQEWAQQHEDDFHDSAFAHLSSFIEYTLINSSPMLFVQTLTALKFLRKYFR